MSQLGLERTRLMMIILLSSPWKLHKYDDKGNINIMRVHLVAGALSSAHQGNNV